MLGSEGVARTRGTSTNLQSTSEHTHECLHVQQDRRRRRAKTKKPAVLLPGRFVQPRKSAGPADREPLLKSKLLV